MNDLKQSANGKVVIELGGLVAVTNYDQVRVNNSALLNGSLNVKLINGFMPSAGNTFSVMTFGSRTGTFAVENGLRLTNNLVLLPVYTATNLALIATNIPLIEPSLSIQANFPTLQLSWPGLPGQAYELQSSTNLIDWFVITNLTATSTAPVLSLTNNMQLPALFYRLR